MSSDEEPRARAMAAAAAASNTSSGGVAAGGGGGGGGGSGGGGGGNGSGGGGGGGDDEAAAKAVQRRYEGLVTVRAKAVKGKGAWYWAHLDPILVHDADRRARAVKLRCMLCNSLFSASNPSRTASEHLKRGTCPNFNFALPLPPGPAPVPVSVQPLAAAPPPSVGGTSRKRGHGHGHGGETPGSSSAGALVLSGGKEDLGALAMLDDTVKKLRSPKGGSPGQPLSRAQVDTALNLLADWLYESCGAVSLSCVEHPKFRSFLAQVGLPPVSRKFLAGAKLDAKFQEVRADSDAKLRDALFFQLSAHGWSSSGTGSGSGSGSSSRSEAGGGPERLVNVTLNLPNGTSLFRRAVFAQGPVGAGDVEDVLSEALAAACGAAGPPERCVGVVADATDRGSARALAELERRHAWMVNLKCQFQAFQRLVKDLCKHCPLVRAAASDCLKLAAFFNNSNSGGGSSSNNNYHCYKGNCSSSSSSSCSLSTQLHKIHLPELQHGTSGLDVVAMMEDVMGAARALHVSLMDDSFKAEDAVAREAAELVRSVRFWTDLEAALQLVRIAKSFAVEVESERPLVGQCLPLWDELRAKIREWCSKFGAEEATVLQIVDKRFVKNYHPAWAAAFILDPLYLIRDSGGKYLPPFQLLRPDQEKDVDRLITRMVSREEAPIAVMELMKWRSEGLDPLYAQAVQVKQRDPVTGKMRIANPQSSRLVWETCLSEFKTLGKVAVRLIFLHATSCGLKCNWSFMRWVYAHGHSRAAMDKVQKMIFIASHARLERRDFANDQDKDAELFANGDEDVLNEVFTEPSSTV